MFLPEIVIRRFRVCGTSCWTFYTHNQWQSLWVPNALLNNHGPSTGYIRWKDDITGERDCRALAEAMVRVYERRCR